MPQMAPMNWTLLLIMFIMIFLMFNSINYFMIKYENKTKNKKFNKKTNNWKW